MRIRSWWSVAASAAVVAAAVAAIAPAANAGGARSGSTAPAVGVGGGKTGLAAGNPFCKKLGKVYQASTGAQMYCFGAHFRASGRLRLREAGQPSASGGPANVNAASLKEDVSPALVRAYGQSETSIAGSGRYVVEAWNDATTFLTGCPSRHFKEEATGVGFSANGGRSFRDIGGLPNPRCKSYVYISDPGVAAYRIGGKTYFYISSMYDSVTGLGQSYIAFDACRATGSGSTARLRCGRPVIAASSTQCIKLAHHKSFPGFCSFLDKDYIAIDPGHGRLYVTYTEFPVLGFADTEVMTTCDIGNRHGQRGPAGGTPFAPVCEHGSKLVKQKQKKNGPFNTFIGKPYMLIAKAGFRSCEEEGSYPAVNPRTGAVYVAYEYNWASNLFFGCNGFKAKTRDIITRTPLSCLRLRPTAACRHPLEHASVAVFSLDAAFIPGYNRFPTNDFPRLAVSGKFGDVSMVWNDTRHNAYGDVLLQSFKLGSLRRVQRFPTVIDRPHGGGLSMFPAMRVSTASGLLDLAWYSRSGTGTADTSVLAAIGVNPGTTTTPPNIPVTNVRSNWLLDSSDIVPNFGDYIDTNISATGRWPYVGNTLYVAWTDGRLGLPQPFEAHIPAGR